MQGFKEIDGKETARNEITRFEYTSPRGEGKMRNK